MAFEDFENLYLRKQQSLGGGVRNKHPHKPARTSPERRFMLRQRDKVRAKTRKI